MYNYNIETEKGIESMFNNLTAGLVVVAIIGILIAVAIIALVLVANCLIFKKAGEKGWKGLIPLYNTWIETKISGLAWWWFIVFAGLTALTGASLSNSYVISMGLILVTFNYNYNLAKKFGKSNGFAFLCTILPIIGLPILAFGSAKYEKDTKVDKNGIFKI